MNKMQMAHQMALELVKIKPSLSAWQIADRCFEYADAMQAEAEKRVNKERPEVLIEEWQPDWSQAPEWAKYWHYNSYHSAYWVDAKPEARGDTAWSFDFVNKRAAEAPSFGYTENWQDSLRKRPQ